MSLLVLNAGSANLKFAVFDAPGRQRLGDGQLNWTRQNPAHSSLVFRLGDGSRTSVAVSVTDAAGATRATLETVQAHFPVRAVGHRVVHGGTQFAAPQRIDRAVCDAIRALCRLAPLHNPPALAAIEELARLLPDVPQVAIFDTAFFARLPERAFLYPLPYEWFERHGIRRIGFHGISNAWCVHRAAELLRRPSTELRLINCHLGGGCSVTAASGGEPVNTTMGFTPMEGLMMGSRSGSIDPGILLHLLREGVCTVDQLDDALNRRSGLLGVSGLAADEAHIEAAAQSGHARAQLALEMFADRIRSAIGALAVSMDRVDALVFTAGIGEKSPLIRRMVCENLRCLGIHLDPSRNTASQGDGDIASPDSAVRVLVLRTQEDAMIAKQTAAFIGDGHSP